MIPTTVIDRAELAAGISCVELFVRTGLCRSRSEARRLIEQGGAYVNEERVASIGAIVTTGDLVRGRQCAS